MYNSSLIIDVGDMIWAYRPTYNGSNEQFPEEKIIRPYVVLKVYENGEYLVAPITSQKKKKRLRRYCLKEGEYVCSNDLYVINKQDIIRNSCHFDDKIISILYDLYYSSINQNEYIFPEYIKEMFLEAYQERLNIPSPEIAKLEVFSKGNIIYLACRPEQKYIIDEVYDDGYLAYRVNAIENNNQTIYKYDFSSKIRLEKNCEYVLEGSISQEEYIRKQKAYLKRLRKQLAKEQAEAKPKFYIYTGSIVKCDDKEYFVVFNTAENKYFCILYNGNYIFEELKVFGKKDVKYIRDLPKDEVLNILEMVRKNISILSNVKVQNKLYMKIMELN